MTTETRRRAKQKKEEVRLLVAESRSNTLPLDELRLELIPGLIRDLNDYVSKIIINTDDFSFHINGSFSMERYREHILSALNENSRVLSDIEVLNEDPRLYKVWRSVTLVLMQHDREVERTQYGNDLLVEQVSVEGYGKIFSGLPKALLEDMSSERSITPKQSAINHRSPLGTS
jgi:hypothetical protein